MFADSPGRLTLRGSVLDPVGRRVVNTADFETVGFFVVGRDSETSQTPEGLIQMSRTGMIRRLAEFVKFFHVRCVAPLCSWWQSITDNQVGWVVACLFCGLFGWALGSSTVKVYSMPVGSKPPANVQPVKGCSTCAAKRAAQAAATLAKPVRFDSVDLTPEPEPLISVGEGTPTPIKDEK